MAARAIASEPKMVPRREVILRMKSSWRALPARKARGTAHAELEGIGG